MKTLSLLWRLWALNPDLCFHHSAHFTGCQPGQMSDSQLITKALCTGLGLSCMRKYYLSIMLERNSRCYTYHAMLVLIYLKGRVLGGYPNTMALYSTHNKATLKTASEANGIDILHGLKILRQKFATTVSTLPILFTYKGAGIWPFSVSGFPIFIKSFCFSWHHHFPIPQIQDSPLWLCKAERRLLCFSTKPSDWWHILISSALVSLSCLIKQLPIPPSICLI